MSYSFNWPDIPFSGTEVDAFVVEYKALAESIMEDYDTTFRYDSTGTVKINPETEEEISGITLKERLKLPFQEKENVRTFLEHGLLYAAFIVKQRAGNAGPGTDFNLENSPLPRPLPEGPTKRTNKDIGPSANEEALKRCFEDHQEGKRNSTGGSGGAGGSGGNGGSGAGPGTGGPGSNPPPGDDPGDDPDDNNGPPPEKFPPGPDDIMRSQQNSENLEECGPVIAAVDAAQSKHPALNVTQCMDILSAGLFDKVISFAGNLRWTYLWKLSFALVYRYLSGVGGRFTLPELRAATSPLAGIWIREDIIEVLNVTGPFVLDLSPAARAGYGMSANDNAYILEARKVGGFKNSLGDFTVITDGTEDTQVITKGPLYDRGKVTMVPNGLTNISQIKQVRDDYDFNDYGFVVDRALGGFAGDLIDDNQIKTGTEWKDPATTPCDAAVYDAKDQGDSKWNPLSPGQWIRYLIARNAGATTEAGQYVNSLCKGKPFGVHFDWR